MPGDVQGATIDLLLADAHDGAPALAAGLPEEAAERAPRPERAPRGVDARTLDAPDADPNDLAAQRWGVIAPEGRDGDRALDAIAPLVRLREEEQGAEAVVYRVPPGMDLAASLRWREEVWRDERVPEEDRPRYLLVLGDLDGASTELQHVLAGGAFVGRIHAAAQDGGTDPEGYAAYADKVVRWAREPPSAARPDAVSFHAFAADDGTSATSQARRLLIDPCVEMARSAASRGRFPGAGPASIDGVDGVDGFVAAVDTERPAVLLSATHGLGRPRGGWRSMGQRRALQGALVVSGGAAAGVLDGAAASRGRFLRGGMWFAVACFGAGTPRSSSFYPWLVELAAAGDYGDRLARVVESLPEGNEPPFLAAMPLAALRNPDGPIAIVAHLDLAWTYGFVDAGRGSASRASRIFATVQAMVRGSRAGAALDALHRAYRDVNDELVASYQAEEEARVWGRPHVVDVRARARAFMLRNDLQRYVLLGDPAAHLPKPA